MLFIGVPNQFQSDLEAILHLETQPRLASAWPVGKAVSDIVSSVSIYLVGVYSPIFDDADIVVRILSAVFETTNCREIYLLQHLTDGYINREKVDIEKSQTIEFDTFSRWCSEYRSLYSEFYKTGMDQSLREKIKNEDIIQNDVLYKVQPITGLY